MQRDWPGMGVLLDLKVREASPTWLCGGRQVGVTWQKDGGNRWGTAAQRCERSSDRPSPGSQQGRIPRWTEEDTRLQADGGLCRDAQGNELEIYPEGLGLRMRGSCKKDHSSGEEGLRTFWGIVHCP